MVGSTYPSVPIPQDNIDSLYQSVLAMRQTVQLLIVNAQNVTDQTITKASQVFSKKSDHANTVATLNNSITTITAALASLQTQVNQLISSSSANQIPAMQTQIAAMQTSITTITNEVATINSEITVIDNALTNHASRITTLENKFPQTGNMVQVTTPFSTTSITYVMMGINLVITADDTQGIIIMNGKIANGTNGQETDCVICYGTGTPPVAGAAQVGTILTQDAAFVATSGGGSFAPFSLAAFVGGLVIGTAYWFGVAVKVTGGTGTISNLDIIGHIIA